MATELIGNDYGQKLEPSASYNVLHLIPTGLKLCSSIEIWQTRPRRGRRISSSDNDLNDKNKNFYNLTEATSSQYFGYDFRTTAGSSISTFMTVDNGANAIAIR